MTSLLLAAVLWIAIHLGIGGVASRAWLASKLGERVFRIAFSAASLLALLYLIHVFVEADRAYLWTAPPGLRLALELLMLPAIWLFLASLSQRNPTLMGGGSGPLVVKGVQRITRHPMLWAFTIWALVHIAVKGDTAALLFFGAFALTALAGMPSVDAKLAAAKPDQWRALKPQTSILPFAAILVGRNKLVWSELPWLGFAASAALWIAAVWAHRLILGYSILPAF